MKTEYLPPSAPPARLTRGCLQVDVWPSGGGHIRWDWLALTRWSGQPLDGPQGHFFYLRDLVSGAVWSPTFDPVRRRDVPIEQSAGERAVIFRCAVDGVESTLKIETAPEGEAEVRTLTLKNLGSQPRRIEVTSLAEVVLNEANTDLGHPAFSKLFVQTERVGGGLLARRRRRSATEHWPWMYYALAGAAVEQWETDRMRFIGRGRSLQAPAALDPGSRLSGSVGNVLDPAFALRTVLELAPQEEKSVAFLLGVEEHREDAVRRIAAWEQGTSQPASPEKLATENEVPPVEAECRNDLNFRCWNGYGGFSADGSEYVIQLAWDGQRHVFPPLPWINVLANPHAGCLLSERGNICTWARNSQANRLTPWSNDPVRDAHAEAVYLRDEESGAVFTAFAGPRPARADYTMRHGWGYSVSAVTTESLSVQTTVFVPRKESVRVMLVEIRNDSANPRSLSLHAFHRLAMAAYGQEASEAHAPAADGVLCVTNRAPGDFQGGVVFAAIGGKSEEGSFSFDEERFVGAFGDLTAPAAVMSGGALDNETSPIGRPCLALLRRVKLAANETITLALVLGEAASVEEARRQAVQFSDVSWATAELGLTKEFWSELVGGVTIRTPLEAVDLMMNGWLAYQNLVCRIWARTAFYQSSGAYGYRDQLQDSGALLWLRPDLAREQILRHAAHQFPEGDVLHWWHPMPSERGLRTKFSDDLLWLPFIVAHYVRTTGDRSILDETVSWVGGPELNPGEDERYFRPDRTEEKATVYEHCCRAIDRSLTVGAHGLPLMGTGDWNDGMNRVGREGRGESVWLGFFLHSILEQFEPFCESKGDAVRVRKYQGYREKLAAALNGPGWDGGWYRRAYYDDGTPLGAAASDECRIDAIAQAWAVLSGVAPADRAGMSLDALDRHLVDDRAGLIRLLTPAFVHTPHDPGYIRGYVAGVRENGGQYTHAACWAVQAMAVGGRRARAAELLEKLSPVAHSRSAEAVAVYRTEPYVVVADIYGEPPHVGRGGWTWYTGSAGWMFRVTLETVLGLSVAGGRELVLQPRIPDEWPGFSLRYRWPAVAGERYDIEVENPQGKAGRVVALSVDGACREVVGGVARWPVFGDGKPHAVEVTMG